MGGFAIRVKVVASTRIGLRMMTRMFRRFMRPAGPHVLQNGEDNPALKFCQVPFFGWYPCVQPQIMLSSLMDTHLEW